MLFQPLAALKRVYDSPLALQSNFARDYSAELAALASEGLISTRVAPERYGRKWRITGIGIDTLRDDGVL